MDSAAYAYPGSRTEAAMVSTTCRTSSSAAPDDTRRGPRASAKARGPTSASSAARARIPSALLPSVPEPGLESGDDQGGDAPGWRVASRSAITPPQETPRTWAHPPRSRMTAAAASAKSSSVRADPGSGDLP